MYYSSAEQTESRPELESSYQHHSIEEPAFLLGMGFPNR